MQKKTPVSIHTVMYFFHLQIQVYPVSHDSWLKEKKAENSDQSLAYNLQTFFSQKIINAASGLKRPQPSSKWPPLPILQGHLNEVL